MTHIKHGSSYFANGYRVLSGLSLFETMSGFPDFSARFPWLGGDLQTIASQIRNNKGKNLQQGTQVQLTLGVNDEALMAHFNQGQEDKPTILMLHGLGGDENSIYMREAAYFFGAQGYSVLRLNLRGSGASAKTSHNIYHAGISDDLRGVISNLPAKYTSSGIVLLGFSLGANIMLKYLGEGGVPSSIKGGVSVSAPVDLKITQVRIAALRNRLYRRYLLKKLKRDFANISWHGTVPTITKVEHLNSIIEFDELVIAPVYGFDGACDYYEKCSSKPFINKISKPSLIIHAHTDPWILPDQYEDISWSGNESVCTVLSQDGGHVGFNAKNLEFPWHLHAANTFISTALMS